MKRDYFNLTNGFHILRFICVLVFAYSAVGSASERRLSPARKIQGRWITPFPVVVIYKNIDPSVSPPSVATMQARLRYRMRIQQSAYSTSNRRVNIEWKPVGALLDFQIVDDGGQDRPTLEFFAPSHMRNVLWGAGYEGTVSSSRLTVKSGIGSRGTFSFTSRLIRGSYRVADYVQEFSVPRFVFVKL